MPSEHPHPPHPARAASPWTWLKPHAAPLLTAALLLLGYSALQLLAPYLTGLAVDRHLLPQNPNGFARLLLALLAVYLVSWLTRALVGWLVTRTGQRLLHALRTALFARLQSLPLRFFDTHATGDLMARVLDDSDMAQAWLSEGLAQGLSHSAQAVGLAVVMLVLAPRLAVAVLAVAPFLALWSGRLLPRLLSAYRRAREIAGRVQAAFQEGLSTVRVAQAFAQEETRQTQVAALTQESYAANLAAQRLGALFAPTLGIFNTAGMVLVLGFGAWELQQGRLSLGLLVTFLGYERRFFSAVQGLLGLAAGAQQARAAWERLRMIWDAAPEVQPPDAHVLPPLRGEVCFEDVTFAYDEGTPVLQGVSFHITPGQCVALVGPTGVGKTTLVNLLLRYYTPQRGRILVDGYDIASVDVASLRRQIGLVLQEPVLFAGTVLENLRFGRPDATEEEVAALMRELGVDDFIRALPGGYATRIGERGVTLSQGQKQLIAIARTLLTDPRILILDEATSSVDPTTEHLLHAALARLREGRTTLLIAHRASTVQMADWVIVLEGGRVVAQQARESSLSELHETDGDDKAAGSPPRFGTNQSCTMTTDTA